MEITDTISPYLTGPYAPIASEIDGDAPAVFGEIPRDLAGIYVRNGPNPRFAPNGRYHWFDGDGMLHGVEIRDGKARYRNRWIRGAHFEREAAAGTALWSGVMESARNNPKDAPYKDTANTDVVFHAGVLLGLWYISGVPVRVDPRTLETLGPARFGGGGERPATMGAHAKLDPRTGELFFFDFGFRPPFMHYGVISKDGEAMRRVPIALSGPRLPHDMAITERHAVLMDLPVVYDEEAMKRNRWVTKFDRSIASRFAIVPRHGGTEDVRWFEAEPCYIYHVVNAWEEANELVMIACRVDDPIPAPRPEDGIWAQMMANLRVRARLHRWRFDLATGGVKEEDIDDLNTEFPAIDLRRRGVPSRHAYNVHIADTRTALFDGLVKYDTTSGAREMLELGRGIYGSEAAFAPRTGGTEEDDGYVLTFVHEEGRDRSELWIIDARRFTDGPVAKLQLPQRVPLGFHATFVAD